MENNTMKPYHLVCYRDVVYMLNIEDMLVTPLDKEDARRLQEKKEQEIDLSIEDQVRLGLRKDKKTKEAMQKEVPVVSLCFFLTQSCNLNCVYCYGEGGTYAKGDMDKSTAFSGVDWLLTHSGKMKQVAIYFFGGEPLLQFPLLKDVVSYAKARAMEGEKTVEFHLTTNATLLDDEIITFIKEEEISVQISFDGPRDLQDAQRPFSHGEKTYDATVPKIKQLLAVCPATIGHAVLVGDTDPARVKEALKEIGFQNTEVRLASPSLFSRKNLQGRALRNVEGMIFALSEERDQWLEGIKSRDLSLLTRLKEKMGLYPSIIALLHSMRQRYPCNAGLSFLALSTEGDLYVCHRFVGQKEYKLGSIFEGEVDREDYLESPIVSISLCESCFAKYYCGGGCRHDHAGITGSHAIPAPETCALRREEMELAMTIVGNLSHADSAFLLEEGIVPQKPCPLDF